MLGCEKAGSWGGELGLWESQSWRMILEWFLLLGNNGYQEPLGFSLSAVVSEIFDLIYMKCRNKKSSFLDYLSYMLWFRCISVVQLMHTTDYMKWTLLVVFTMGTSTKPSHLGLREHWWRGVWKDCKQTIKGGLLWDSVWWYYQKLHPRSLPNMPVQTWAEQWGCQWTCQIAQEKPIRPQAYTRTTSNWRKLGAWGEVIPREDLTN